MGSTVAVIDLDVAPVPVTTAWRPRRALPALVAVLCGSVLLALGGAAAPAPAGVVRVASTEGRFISGSLLAPPVLYTAERGAGLSGGWVIRAAPLTAGAPAWTAEVPRGGEDVALTLRRSARVLVVDGGPNEPVTFLDADTGVRLWQAEMFATVVPGGHAVVEVEAGFDDNPGTLRLADPRTGRTVWSHPGVQIALAVADDTSRYLVAVEGSGRVTTYRFADGKALATERFAVPPELWGTDDPGFNAYLRIDGDLLYAYGENDSVPFLSAYRVDTLHRVWTAAGIRHADPHDCAGVLCVGADNDLTVLDRRDGSVRWTRRQWQAAATPVGGLIFVADPGTARAALVDPADGRVVRALGAGVATGGLMLRTDSGRPGRLWVIDLRTGHAFGDIARAMPGSCTTALGYLACRLVDDSMTVWRVR
jgi:hypothetical protein